MAEERKYGHVQTTRGHIRDDEPTFLFRAADAKALPQLVRYLGDCILADCPDDHIQGVIDAIRDFKRWQRENRPLVKNPD